MLPNDNGEYAIYFNSNWRQSGWPKDSANYFAVSGYVYGPYLMSDLYEMIEELKEMLERGDKVTKLPGCRVERAKLSDGKEIS